LVVTILSIKENKNESVDTHYLQNIKERCNHAGATCKENYDGSNYACIFNLTFLKQFSEDKKSGLKLD